RQRLHRSRCCGKPFYGLLDLLLLRAWHIHKGITGVATLGRQRGPPTPTPAPGMASHSYWLSGFSEQWQVTAIDVKEEQVAGLHAFFKPLVGHR
ncbi:MAG: hypothetical protein IPI41_08010, partial [Flavobacteriales bacterium]|nr:hypothetical protein [Flavobacteriales bacterium]